MNAKMREIHQKFRNTKRYSVIVKLGFSQMETPANKAKINKELKKLVLYPVGLALGTYIIAQNEEGIYMIDQHAAQERINYEKYMKNLKICFTII